MYLVCLIPTEDLLGCFQPKQRQIRKAKTQNSSLKKETPSCSHSLKQEPGQIYLVNFTKNSLRQRNALLEKLLDPFANLPVPGSPLHLRQRLSCILPPPWFHFHSDESWYYHPSEGLLCIARSGASREYVHIFQTFSIPIFSSTLSSFPDSKCIETKGKVPMTVAFGVRFQVEAMLWGWGT